MNTFLFEEDKINSSKNADTQKMLEAGADKAFYCKSSTSLLKDSFNAFLKNVCEGSIIIVESLSIRKLLKPGVFILIDSESNNQKDRYSDLKQFADIIVISKNIESFDLNRIKLDCGNWSFSKNDL